jgi:hypothetical protein
MPSFAAALLPFALLASCLGHQEEEHFLSSPSQQELEAAILLTRSGQLTALGVIELDDGVSLENVNGTDLARLLGSCQGFELAGLDLTEEQWVVLAKRSRQIPNTLY